MPDSDDAAADILTNQPGPSPGNAPGGQHNDRSSAGQNVMADAPNAVKGNPASDANSPVDINSPADAKAPTPATPQD